MITQPTDIIVIVAIIIAILIITFIIFIISKNSFNNKGMTKLLKNAIETEKSILDSNEEALKEIAKKSAIIEKEALKIKASAIKEGILENKTYCKYCKEVIDSNSNFCKKCGKKQ